MRSYVRTGIVAVMLCSMLFSMGYASAQAVRVPTPGYTARLATAIDGIVASKLARWGIAANDPRYTATVKGISGGLTIIAGVGMAGGAAISWPALLGAAGISAVALGALSLAADKDFKWTFGANGSVSASGSVPGVNVVVPPKTAAVGMAAGQIVYGYTACSDGKNYNTYGTNGQQLFETYMASCLAYIAYTSIDCYGGGQVQCSYTSPQGSGSTVIGQSYSPVSSASGYYDNRPPPSPVVIAPTTYATPAAAVAAVPASLASSPVSNEMLAAAVNAAWKSADSANATGGVPWSASDPITSADVQSWGASTGAAGTVTVGDFTAPANATSGASTIAVGSAGVAAGGSTGSGSTGTGTGTGTVTAPVTTAPVTTAPVTEGEGTEINWGPNPNVGAPAIEDTPTAPKILDPIFNMMPDLKTFAVPAHAGVCPVASFGLYGHAYSVDSHCQIMEDNRALIGAMMVLMFTIAATFIVLRA